MTVQALLEFFGELRSGRSVKAEVASWLQRLDLASRASAKVETLSKGMSQKVQFIATVIPEPKLLILDEPFSGLDPVSADAIRSAILDLRRHGVTVILSTHDMQLAETMCELHLHDLPRQEGARRNPQLNSGSIWRGHHTGFRSGRHRCRAAPARRRADPRSGQVQELRLARGADPQDVLRALVEQARVTSFSLMKPSLYDIFMRIAGPAAEEANRASA